MPPIQSELAVQTLKDPFIFDFLTLTEDYKEKDLEDQLVKHITQFLLELILFRNWWRWLLHRFIILPFKTKMLCSYRTKNSRISTWICTEN